jgi:hypothetical protein
MAFPELETQFGYFLAAGNRPVSKNDFRDSRIFIFRIIL